MFKVNKVWARCKYTVFSVMTRQKQVWTSEKIVNSPFRDVVVPDMTAYEYVWRHLDKWPTKTAAVCATSNRSYTYEQLYKQTQIFGANLRKKFKIKDGDTIGIMMSNTPEYFVVVNGILAAGGIVTTFNTVYTAHEIQRQILISETKIIIAQPDLVPIIKEAIKLSKADQPIITVNLTGNLPVGTVSYKELVEDNHADTSTLKEVQRDADDVAFLLYSSGTSGLPKGLQLTNKNVIANFVQASTEFCTHSPTTATNQDTTLVCLPMFHAYGLLVVMMDKLSAGLKVVSLPNFTPESFVNSLVDYKIKLLHLAPPMVLMLASNPQVTAKQLQYLDYVLAGAAPISAPDIEKLISKMRPDANFSQGYGLTETGPLVSLSPKGNKNLFSVGYPLPNMKLRVVDETMNNLGPNELGELLVKGPNIMKGYKDNPKGNKEAFLEDGWLRTGDLVQVDETGLITVADRLKDLIKVNAFQVPPAELESIVKEHPAVSDAAVIGVPDPLTGERPRAYVVTKLGCKVDENEIMKFVSGKVARFKRIKEVVFVETIPKSPSGKILKRVLKEQCT